MRLLTIALAGLLVAGSIAWFAAEQRYGNCVDAAKAANPSAREGSFEAFMGDDVKARRKALDDCSRLPW